MFELIEANGLICQGGKQTGKQFNVLYHMDDLTDYFNPLPALESELLDHLLEWIISERVGDPLMIQGAKDSP